MKIEGEYFFSSEDEFKDLDLSNFPSILEAFERRIQGWFFEPLKKLLVDEANLFVASAVECMLVDAFSGFHYGIVGDTSKHDFIRLLKESLNIEENTAEEFYKRFRCGILHQTNIKKNSCITQETASLYLQNEDDILFFNPIGFYKLLDEYFRNYMRKLRVEEDLQMSFRTRFYHLFWGEFGEDKWSGWFEAIDNYERDIQKSISIILEPKGVKESDPDFGMTARWIFGPFSDDSLQLMENEARDGLAVYEPRIKILNLRIKHEHGLIAVEMTYEIKSTKKIKTMTFQKAVDL